MRAIPDNNLAYPVLIRLASGSQGSGFYLNSPPHGYLITAAHVLFTPEGVLRPDTALLRSYSQQPDDPGHIEYKADLSSLNSAGHVRRHAVHDIAAVRLFSLHPLTPNPGYFCRTLPGVLTAAASSSGAVGVAPEALRLYADVKVANDVVVFGFPGSLGLKDMPQFDRFRPLLRRGIVAAKYPERRTLVLDCAVFPGNSGGPVLEIEHDRGSSHYRVAGVLTEFIPFTGYPDTEKQPVLTNSGYAVAVASDAILEVVHGFA